MRAARKTVYVLPGAKFEGFKSRLNETIHELVFAVRHLDQGDPDDLESALTCLTTAQETVESVAEEIAREAGSAGVGS